MANKTIPQLPTAGSLTGAEYLELDQSATSVSVTLSTLLAWKTLNPIIQTANYNANNYDYIIADTTGGGFTITLPASPSFGETVWIVDGAGTWNTNNLTIAGNGANIMGSPANL